jgi:hypothetical protein
VEGNGCGLVDILSLRLPGRDEENREKSVSWEPVSPPRFELSTVQNESDFLFRVSQQSIPRPVVGRLHVPARTSVRPLLFHPNGTSQTSERKLWGHC